MNTEENIVIPFWGKTQAFVDSLRIVLIKILFAFVCKQVFFFSSYIFQYKNPQETYSVAGMSSLIYRAA